MAASSLRCAAAGRGVTGASGCTNLQLGQEGEALQSMTRRWQLAHGTATMLLPPELITAPPPVGLLAGSASSSGAAATTPSGVEMLRSRLTLCSRGLTQLFLSVFLLRV